MAVQTHDRDRDRDVVAVEEDRLHLGCDEQYRSGWHNVDVNADVRTDTCTDLSEPWPFPDDSVDHVLAEHVIEHVPDLEQFFTEAARVLRAGGTLEVAVPVGVDARADPTHQHEFTWRTPEFVGQDGANWGYQLPLRLEDRSLTVWFHNPLNRFSPVAKHIANRWPITACGLPCMSGELRATWRRVE